MTQFVTSDHDFGNADTIDYRNRPFSSVEEMTEEYIKQWNNVVEIHDLVYYLGNFSSSNSMNYVLNIFDRLNGDIFLLDRRIKPDNNWLTKYHKSASFQRNLFLAPSILILPVNKVRVTLYYHPLEKWDEFGYNGVHIYGTTYNDLSYVNNRYSASVDIYPAPVPIENFLLG